MVKLLSYRYPDEVTLLIDGKMYIYESSEYHCRRLMKTLDKAQFRALNEFKKVAKLKKPETWPTGIRCDRDAFKCISNEKDSRCYGETCPMKEV